MRVVILTLNDGRWQENIQTDARQLQQL